MFLETFTAINRTTFCRSKWNLTLFTAIRTSCLVHRSRATVPTSSITQMHSPLLTYTAKTNTFAGGNKRPPPLLNFPYFLTCYIKFQTMSSECMNSFPLCFISDQSKQNKNSYKQNSRSYLKNSSHG